MHFLLDSVIILALSISFSLENMGGKVSLTATVIVVFQINVNKKFLHSVFFVPFHHFFPSLWDLFLLTFLLYYFCFHCDIGTVGTSWWGHW